MAEEPTLEDLNRRLAEIQDRLLALDPDDFAARYELQTERDRLRRLAREHDVHRDAQRSSDDLRAELEAPKTSLGEIERRMVNPGGMAGGGGAAAGSYEGPLDAMEINNAIRAAKGTDQLVRRITHLESVLRERGDL